MEHITLDCDTSHPEVAPGNATRLPNISPGLDPWFFPSKFRVGLFLAFEKEDVRFEFVTGLISEHEGVRCY